MHIYGKDQQAFHLTRTRAEKYISRGNTIIVALQLGCFVSAMIRLSVLQSKSMSNSIFVTSPLNLSPVYESPNCTMHVDRSHAFFRKVTYDLSADNIEYFVSRSVLNMRYLLALTGVLTVVSIINRVWFETNTHEIRYNFVVFRKDTVTTWEVMLLSMGLVMTLSVNQENTIIWDYVQVCNDALALLNPVYNSVVPFVELYVLYFVCLSVTVLNVIVSIWNLSKTNPHDEFIKQEEARRKEWQDMIRAQNLQSAGARRGTSASQKPIIFANTMAPVGDVHPSHSGLLGDSGRADNPEPTPVPHISRAAASTSSQKPPLGADAPKSWASTAHYTDPRQQVFTLGGAPDTRPSNTGRYVLREVQDEELPDRRNATFFSSRNDSQVQSSSEPLMQDSLPMFLPSGEGSLDHGSTLLATRNAAVPPPPPVAGQQQRRSIPPPSPHTAGGDTTDDTMRVQP